MTDNERIDTIGKTKAILETIKIISLSASRYSPENIRTSLRYLKFLGIVVHSRAAKFIKSMEMAKVAIRVAIWKSP